jgi:hypothetical protein
MGRQGQHFFGEKHPPIAPPIVPDLPHLSQRLFSLRLLRLKANLITKSTEAIPISAYKHQILLPLMIFRYLDSALKL